MDDPASPAVDELVEFLSAELGLDTALPVRRRGGGEIFAGDLAARAHVQARAGEVDDALTLLLKLCEALPGTAWLSGGALSDPAVRRQLDTVETGSLLAS